MNNSVFLFKKILEKLYLQRYRAFQAMFSMQAVSISGIIVYFRKRWSDEEETVLQCFNRWNVNLWSDKRNCTIYLHDFFFFNQFQSI